MAEPLTEEQLAEIEGRADAATPETWVWSWSTGWSTDGLGHYLVETARSRIVVAITTREKQGYENALFIAHARTDVPLLVAEVRRLNEALIELATAVEHERELIRALRTTEGVWPAGHRIIADAGSECAMGIQRVTDLVRAALDHREGE